MVYKNTPHPMGPQALHTTGADPAGQGAKASMTIIPPPAVVCRTTKCVKQLSPTVAPGLFKDTFFFFGCLPPQGALKARTHPSQRTTPFTCAQFPQCASHPCHGHISQEHFTQIQGALHTTRRCMSYKPVDYITFSKTM